MPCLRTDDTTYTFAIPAKPDGPVTFYCVIFEKDMLTQTDIERLQTALGSATTYSGGADAAAAALAPTWDDGQDATDQPAPRVAEDSGQGNSKVCKIHPP